jgi:hypothetical protein
VKRTPLKRSTKGLKRTPLRRVSLQRKSELQAYYQARQGYLEKNPWCEALIGEANCSIRAGEIHHLRGRENEKLNDEKYFLPICRNCHVWIHDHPNKAREMGLLK